MLDATERRLGVDNPILGVEAVLEATPLVGVGERSSVPGADQLA